MVYTATDGTQFADRNEWRKYEFETQYTFKNKENERLVKFPGQIDGQPFDLADLNACEVMLLDHSDQIQMDNLVNCRIFIGPCCESVFIRNCSDCVITIACKQLRTRDCTSCDIYLYSLTDPIIETSSGMRFAPFNGGYNGILQHFGMARLDPENTHWSRVYDFNDPEKSGKNWEIMDPEDEAEAWLIPLNEILPNADSLGPCENPVRRDAKFINMEDGSPGGVTAFSFDTTQEQAAHAMHGGQETSGPFDAPAMSALPLPPPQPPVSSSSSSTSSSSKAAGAPTSTSSLSAVPLPPPTPTTTSSTKSVSSSSSSKSSSSSSSSSTSAGVPASAPTLPSAPTSSSSSSSSSLGISSGTSWPKLEAFQAQWNAQLLEKQKKEANLIKEVKKRGEEDLDKFYEERTDRLAHRAATNREQEATKLESLALLKEKAIQQPWTRAVDLIEAGATNSVNRKKDNPTTTVESKETSNKPGGKREDTSRMRSILVQLKNSGGLEIQKA